MKQLHLTVKTERRFLCFFEDVANIEESMETLYNRLTKTSYKWGRQISIKYSEVGFRAFYHNFIAIPMKDSLRAALHDFHGADKANYILTYGYIDHTAGLTLEVLAAAFRDDKGFSFEVGNKEISSKIRIGSVMDDECFYFDDEDGSLYKL